MLVPLATPLLVLIPVLQFARQDQICKVDIPGHPVLNASLIAKNCPCRCCAVVGLKPQHFQTILDEKPDLGWFEIHARKLYGCRGSTASIPLDKNSRALSHLSVHGVGLSIGGARSARQAIIWHASKRCIDRYQPQSFSEHLAWSSHQDTLFQRSVGRALYEARPCKPFVIMSMKMQNAVGAYHASGKSRHLYRF